MRLAEPRRVQVGRLGAFDLNAGRYVYVGSAMNGLESRTTRHIEGCGRKRWHIDHLACLGVDREALLIPSDEDIECSVADRLRAMPGVSEPIAGFGSSDCRCRSHLFLVDDNTYSELKRHALPSSYADKWLLPSHW